MNHGWEKKKLGDIGTIITGSTPKTTVESYYDSDDFMFVKPSDIGDNSLNELNISETYISSKAYNEVARKLPKGTVLVTCIGIIGKVAILCEEATCNQQINAIIPNDTINNKFLGYGIMSIRCILVSKKNGPVVPIINKSQFSNFQIPVPTNEVQERIVRELDKLNELIELKRNQLKDLDTLAQSLFYETFGDPIENPKGWESILLEECVNDNCPISYGIVQPGEDVANGTPLVRPVDFGANRCVFNKNLKHVSPSISESYKRTILKGDEILICVRGTTGLVKLSHTSLRGANVTRGIVPIQIKSQLSKIYIYEYLKRERAQSYIQSYTKGIALKQINLSDLRSLPILLPPVSLQNEFAEKIEAIEEQKRLIESSISDLETLLASRMDYWFND